MLFGASVIFGVGLGYSAVHDLAAGGGGTTALVQANGSAAGSTSGTAANVTSGATPGATPSSISGNINTGTTASTSGGPVSGGNPNIQGGSTNPQCNLAPIVAGAPFDETGAVDSTVERDTVRAYFKKYGCINGHPVEELDCDSQYDATRAQECANVMIQDKVISVVGMTAPKGEDGVVQTFVQAGIPVIGGLGTPQEYSYHLSYPTSAAFTRFGTAIGYRVAAQLGYKHPAILDLSDVPWLQTVEATLIASLQANGATGSGQGNPYTDKESVMSTQADYTQTVFSLEHNGCTTTFYGKNNTCPDVLIAAMDPYSYVKLFNAMQAAGWNPPILATGLDKGSFQSDYVNSGEMGNPTYSLVPYLSPYDNTNNATVADYLSTVKTFYPNQYGPLDVYTQIAWTAAMVFVHALHLVADANKPFTPANVAAAIDTITGFNTGWSIPLSYNQSGNHDPNICYVWMQYSNGWHSLNGGHFNCPTGQYSFG